MAHRHSPQVHDGRQSSLSSGDSDGTASMYLVVIQVRETSSRRELYF